MALRWVCPATQWLGSTLWRRRHCGAAAAAHCSVLLRHAPSPAATAVRRRRHSSRPHPPPPLSRRIVTVPNALTCARIALVPCICHWALHGESRLALAAFALAGFTDFLDGYVAKRYRISSVLGSFLDPLADKLLIGSLSVTLAVLGHLPVEIVGLVVARDALLVVGTSILRSKLLPGDAWTWRQFFDVSTVPSHEVRPSLLSKVNTTGQLLWVFLALCSPVFGVPDANTMSYVGYSVAATTIASGVDYAFFSHRSLRRLLAKHASSK